MKSNYCLGCGKELKGINQKFCSRECHLNHKHHKSKEIIKDNIDNMINLFNSGRSVSSLSREFKISMDLVRSEFSKRGIGRIELGRQFGRNSHNWKGWEGISGRYWSSLKCGAKSRGIKFDLRPEDIWNKFIEQDRKCALTGLKLSLRADLHTSKEGSKEIDASLDRIDSSKGYEPTNIQWVHKIVQIMKNRWSNDEYVRFCHLVASNNPLPTSV